jgi:hypothetical protein
VLWNMAIPTDWTIDANKPDMVLFDKVVHHIYIVEFSCPFDINIVKKHAEKKVGLWLLRWVVSIQPGESRFVLSFSVPLVLFMLIRWSLLDPFQHVTKIVRYYL